MQHLDERLGFKLRSNDVAGLGHDYQPVALFDLRRLLTWPRQVLGECGQHVGRHNGASLPTSLSNIIAERQIPSFIHQKGGIGLTGVV